MTKNSALKTGATALAAAALGVGLAACGSSKAQGVALAPSAGATVEAVTATTAAATTTAATATSAVSTPTSGPLSKEPTASKPSGPAPKTLVKKTLVAGTGPTVVKGDSVTINFFGYLYATGKPFSGGSTWTSTTKATPYGPVAAGEGDFVKGFDEALVGAKQGSRVQVIIPPSLGYGNKAQSSIPANSTLIFDIDILKVSK